MPPALVAPLNTQVSQLGSEVLATCRHTRKLSALEIRNDPTTCPWKRGSGMKGIIVS